MYSRGLLELALVTGDVTYAIQARHLLDSTLPERDDTPIRLCDIRCRQQWERHVHLFVRNYEDLRPAHSVAPGMGRGMRTGSGIPR